MPQATGGNTRFSDTEFKLLNQIGQSSPHVRGTINLHADFAVCTSCSSVISQFRDAFPGVRLNLTTGG
ncbi:deaminase domain-containing protein [Amycolatopsis azurea]|uniref:deaminase domain-containing protein n=1 Tax=Amycolatopsis azurea TaxID=36819 RepID=UPI0037F6B4AF